MFNLYKFLSLLLLVSTAFPNYSTERYIKFSLLLGNSVPRFDQIDGRIDSDFLSWVNFSEYLEKPLLLIQKHETAELKKLLQSDPTINVNKQEKIFGATLLMFAAALGHEDIVDLLCEFGANPLLTTNNYTISNDYLEAKLNPEWNVFNIIQLILDHKKLSREQIACYERIKWMCKVQAKALYGLAFLHSGKGKSEEKENEIKEVVKRALLPVILGTQISNIKPSQPHQNPPFIERKYPSLRPPYYKRFLSFIANKTSPTKAAMGVAGALALGYAVYWYFSKEKPVPSVDIDDQPMLNSTNIYNTQL